MYISRTMCWEPDKPLNSLMNELRAAMQLERRFSRRELFTISANRMYFGEGMVGVEGAAQHYFHKEPNQLLVGEAALLAGLVNSPARFSPTKHPDRAIQRRNQVIDAMLQAHTVSEADATTAKAVPIASLN